MAILLIVFYILSPPSTYNIQTTSPIYYQFYYYSLYFYILNLSSKERPYLLLSLSIQLGRYTTKYLQKFTRLFYQTSLTILLYIRNQTPKSHLDYLLSSLIQIYPRLSYYYSSIDQITPSVLVFPYIYRAFDFLPSSLYTLPLTLQTYQNIFFSFLLTNYFPTN